MKTNPFCLPDAPAWLEDDPIQQIPRLLERLLEVAAHAPHLYETLPWLKGMDAWGLVQERFSELIFPDTPPSPQEATLTGFFARVTEPIAKMVEALYASRLLRDTSTVGEILSRMAQDAGREALPQEVVTGICASLVRRRLDALGQEPIRPQAATWKITWHPTSVWVRSPMGVKKPFLVLVTDEATKKILAFRCTSDPPNPTEVSLVLYDALVFPSSAERHFGWHLSPPTRVCVQSPLPKAIQLAALVWRIEVGEIPQKDCAFLQTLDRELASRTLDPVHYLRILDRACERAYGYAPLLAKQRSVQKNAWCVHPYNDPLRHYLGLRELLPSFPAIIGEDGTVEWQGWHYRDSEEDVLRYFPHAAVMIRPSPSTEATISVYWNEAILCYATASELRHTDGSYRPYWFPYPRLGE